LKDLEEYLAVSPEAVPSRVRGLIDKIEDGRAQLYRTWKIRGVRREFDSVFKGGRYIPLPSGGARGDHLFAFARQHRNRIFVAVAPRWFARLMKDSETPPLGRRVWRDTWIKAPVKHPKIQYVNCFTGERVSGEMQKGIPVIPAAQVLSHFPVALLRVENSGARKGKR
jgi:(1->4)-alpha-D-glucan 1-alpha-D-glucosylmutase